MQQLTLVYLVKNGSICLGYKKRGFGAGNWNGYGGKVCDGESIAACALRELEEESGVQTNSEALEPVAFFTFIFPEGTKLAVHAFFIRAFKGEPVETEEMRPKWFSFTQIPYEQMWSDDQYWIPRVLLGEQLVGSVWFDKNNGIDQMEWERTDTSNLLARQ